MWTTVHKIYPSISLGYPKCKHTGTNVIQIFQGTLQMSSLEFQKHSQWHNPMLLLSIIKQLKNYVLTFFVNGTMIQEIRWYPLFSINHEGKSAFHVALSTFWTFHFFLFLVVNHVGCQSFIPLNKPNKLHLCENWTNKLHANENKFWKWTTP
jgi:hypothetical protein